MTAPGGNWEAQRVAELRGRPTPVPWAHVAKQVGKTVEDVRNRYDPERSSCMVLPELSAVEPARSKRPQHLATIAVTAARYHSGEDPNSRPNLALAALAEKNLTVRQLGDELNWLPKKAAMAMGGLVKYGLAEAASNTVPRIWRITPAGRAKLERARG